MRNLYHIPVIQDHLVAGHSATWQNLAGNAAVIPHEERVRCPGLPWTLYALSANPWRRCTPAFGHTTVVLEDGQELTYHWCHDGIALMSSCDSGRAAEMQPQTVRLMDLTTSDAYCSSRTSSG